MPKIIDNIRNGRAPLTPSPADIEAKITDAERQHEALESDHSRAALEAEGGVPGAGERLSGIIERRRSLRARVDTLRSALVAAQQDERQRQARQRERLFKENLARITAAFAQRDEAAKRLSDNIAGAVKAWRDLVELSDKAALPLPGTELPIGALVSGGALRRAVEREIYRLGATSINHVNDFPGGRPHDLELLDLPERLPALTDVIREASDYALATVTAGAVA